MEPGVPWDCLPGSHVPNKAQRCSPPRWELRRAAVVYLVHGVRILLGENHVHGVGQLLKLESARVLAIFLVTGILSCFLGLLHL